MKPIKILSLDGGGTRGIFHLHFLNALEKRMGKCICEIFDYIGGTSIGGISALMLTHPLKILNYSQNSKLQDLIDLDIQGKLINAMFGKTRRFYSLPRLGFFGPKYGDRTNAIQKFYDNELFGQVNFGGLGKCFTMVFSYDTWNMQAKVFKSWSPDHQGYSASIVARATSAAPTYFPAVQVIDPEGERETLIDGGVVANDPSIFTVYEARKRAGDSQVPITLVSLGTSEPVNPLSFRQIGDKGILGWAPHFLKVLFDSQATAYTYLNGHDSSPHNFPVSGNITSPSEHYIEADGLKGLCDCHLGYNNIRYFRFVPLVGDALDSRDPTFLCNVQKTAENFFKCYAPILDLCVSDLSN